MADDIFSDEEIKALETAEQATDTPAETPAETPEQPRDEHGRFVPKEPVEETPEPEAEPKERTVPQGALHAEREKRKGIEAELKKAQEQLQALARLREQVAARQAPAAPEPQAEDPAGVQHLTTRLSQLEQAQHTTQQERDEAALQAAEDEQLGVLAQRADEAYRAQVPDYDDAVRYVIQARAKELSMYGYSQPQIERAIGAEARDILRSAVQQGRDPADLIYNIAQARGYRSGTGETPQAGQALRQVEAVANAKSQSRSLGQAAGATPKQLNADALTAMSDDEFGELYNTAEGKKLIDSIMMGNA